MSDLQWKLMVRFMIFALDLLSKVNPPTAASRIEADQLMGDLENQLK